MTCDEFSNEFDVLLDSSSVRSPDVAQSPLELNEYEKSVLLTEAQELFVKELYNGTWKGDSFEETEEVRRSLSSLIQTTYPAASHGSTISRNSFVFDLPEDAWFILYESAVIDDPKAGCLNGTEMQVIPMTQDEYNRSSRNPFRKPSDRKAIRLDKGKTSVEIASKYNISGYIVRYIQRPGPIILTDLGDLTINGISSKTECGLNSVTHRSILERAVQLALSRMFQTRK